MIKYRETFEIVTPESAEQGDVADSGFIDENAEATFRDMVKLLRGTEPSNSPADASCWYTAYNFDHDYRTGAEESRSYHPADDSARRYMFKAWKTANKRTA